MYKIKLFGISFCTIYILTAWLCYGGGYPLMVLWDYSFSGFVDFGILIGYLCFCLVFVNLPFLTFIKKAWKIKWEENGYYLLGTFIILQVATLSIGYFAFSDWLYGYKGAGNGHIYVFTVNTTALIIAFLYAKKQKALAKRRSEIQF